MAASSNIWTPRLSLDFHRSVVKLHNQTETPVAAQSYRENSLAESEAYLLSFKDELQIADDLAFLSHWKEGADYISAITLQEHTNTLVVLLASNKTPSQTILDGLEDIAEILVKYSSQSKSFNLMRPD
jgi:hypothetical protein